MFGKCSEKDSECVRKWCGRSTNLPTPGRPHQFRTFSEHFPNIFPTFPNISSPNRERGEGGHPLIPNMSEHFRTFPNIFRTFY